MILETHEQEVRVDVEGWQRLVDGTAGDAGEQVLGVAGMAWAIEAARAPAAVLELDAVTPGGRFTHLAWVSEQAVALLIDAGGERRRLLALPPDHLPVALARLVGTGPRRPGPREAHERPATDLAEWFAAPDSSSSDGLRELGADRAWTLGVASGTVADDVLSIVVADGPGGAWSVRPTEAGPWLVEPVSSTFVYRRLAGLLPGLDDAG